MKGAYIIQESEDDMWDIGLLRQDYDRLIEILQENYGKHGLICSVKIQDLVIEQPYWVHLSPFDVWRNAMHLPQGIVKPLGSLD